MLGRLVWLMSVAALALPLSACVVVEDESPRGSRFGGSNVREDGRPVDLGGPVAAPAVGARVANSRVLVGVQRLGSVPFDGQVLPVVSPDGRFLTVQTGEAPTWATLLAAPDQEIPARTDIAVYSLMAESPQEIDLAEPLPPGTVLGRSADDNGFLVERITPQGGRVVERVSWLTGSRTLVSYGDPAESVGSHATLMPRESGSDAPLNAGVIWSERPRLGSESGLRSRLGDVRRSPGRSLMMPTAGTTPETVYAVSIERSSDGGRSELIELRVEDAGRVGVRARVSRRVPLAPTGSPLAAYQSLGAVQTPLPGTIAGVAGARPPGFLFFHPARGRMAMLDRSSGAIVSLADDSLSAAWHVRVDAAGRPRWGVFVSTAEGLKYQAVVERRSSRGWTVLGAAPVLSESYVVRMTSDEQWPYLLIGPNRNDRMRLDILRLRVLDDEEN